ncbi:LITAF-like zinc ribbon domain-containing protein [Cytobacillus pseudoceanisediminis]|uniref:LITAF-like zinc ribbon domain-containing protein n=1 Tax=Cytobacillus pseudoceanisediminis TaxID=3051614 RepID=UPI002188948A|nr:LITAF-like zinc ribbon domain-containing protein [Cytobacillus pseudoceanisediminis]UQX52272.1 LITAF-like zinc ribbon domain-containing protein [Cytobacillus pseudoceanisediminis]
MNETKGQQIIHCPQCGENKVKSTASAFKSMLTLGILACVTIIGIPIGIILIISAFVMKHSKKRLIFRCQECKHDFKVNDNTYDDYLKAIGQ